MTHTTTMQTIAANNPGLTVAGFNLNPGTDPDWSKYEEAFALCLSTLVNLKLNKSVGKGSPTTYGLKHLAERFSDHRGKHIYVPEGVMIAALIQWGVPIKQEGGSCYAAINRRHYDRWYDGDFI